MGNVTDKTAEPAQQAIDTGRKASDYLDEQEQRHLWLAFLDLFSGREPGERRKSKSGADMFTPCKESFVDVLSRGYNPFLAEVMYDYIVSKKVATYNSFEYLVIDCARVSSNRSLQRMWDLSRFAAKSHEHLAGLTSLHCFCYVLLMFSLGGQPLTDQQAVEESARVEDFFVACHKKAHGVETHDLTIEEIASIANDYLPHAYKAFQTFFCILLFRSFESPSYTPFLCVEVMGDSEVVSPCDLALFGLHNDEMQGAWKRLYSSAADGVSFNRLEHHMLGYDGPTCILIKCANEEQTRLGAFTSTRWIETNRFYGSASSLLFTISPKLRMYRSKPGGNGNYMWMNSKAYALPHGLGMGGTLPGQGNDVSGFRFFIPDTLEGCIANHTCPTFEHGPLVPGQRFEIDVLEVWACGGVERLQKGLSAQKCSRKLAQETIDKARKVDKATFFNNSFDQEFLLSQTMQHKQYQSVDERRASRDSESSR